MLDDCQHCEEMMQPYVDGELSEEEREEAEAHLRGCEWCARHFRFEEELRHFVKVATTPLPMDPSLKQRLAALRTPLE
jgi:anti-sigma factor RsiW